MASPRAGPSGHLPILCTCDYICPRCESGFVEAFPEVIGVLAFLPRDVRRGGGEHLEARGGGGVLPFSSGTPPLLMALCPPRSTENGSAPSTDQSRQPFENVDQPLFTLPQGSGHFAFGIFDDSFEIPTSPPGAQADDGRDPESRREREQHSRHRIIQQLVNGIITPATIPNLGLGPWGVLHSNPMDYAWGANGLDAIITQLLNQFENTGPPPADKEKIQALPTVPVTEEHVGSGLECPVCKDDFGLGERVRQLPCNHLFHDGCIVPWLEQPGRCPAEVPSSPNLVV
ncbi:RING finger protein 126 [Camelus ferus]|nr:RING finger protein 126 [Camelus ferus]